MGATSGGVMALRIEDYALIGDCHTAALVGRDGSIDWLCLPRFDSSACFAALLGTPDHGRFLLAPSSPVRSVQRRYREGTLVLETTFVTDEGEATVVDCMVRHDHAPRLVRQVVGVRGSVPMRAELVIRFDYGHSVPWVRSIDGTLRAIAGPDLLLLHSGVPTRGKDLTTVADFNVARGQRIPFVLTWCPSHEEPPAPLDPATAIAETAALWEAWSKRCPHVGPWRDAIVRSLITLKALTDARTGGIVAAPTTSLPERIGGVRNWDYRFCWVRDATFTLYSLLQAGYREEASAWREWLLRAVAGTPSQLQIMYGVAGERRLLERPIPWLPGYEGSAPVRVGNAASEQFQLDVYGELIDAMHQCYRFGLEPDEPAWNVQRALLDFLESNWDQPDDGIWEVRGPRRDFTHSKVMAWLALDRAIKTVERFGMQGNVDHWRRTRAAIFEQVCRRGYDASLGAFVQSYGSKHLDASLLMIPLVGFLPPDDPRVRGTIDAVEKELFADGFVRRYTQDGSVDGLPQGEGAFLACTFWFVDNLRLIGRVRDARAIFERALSIRNDVGLLAEEYDPEARRMLGNFPQAFSHVALINTAFGLSMPKEAEYSRHQT
jgi:GH15 family glucan-1,4-alpha-glucosidase